MAQRPLEDFLAIEKAKLVFPIQLTVLQLLPALESGGVERGTLEVNSELVRRGHRSIVISAGGRMVGELIAQGGKHITWPIGAKSPWTLRLMPRLRRFIVENEVNVLHARSRLPAWIGYLAWRGMPTSLRPRFITTVHGPYSVGYYSAVMARGERVIAISETIRDYILASYPHTSPDGIRVIYRGIDRRTFPYGYAPSEVWQEQWVREYPNLRGKALITLPARVTRWKGHEDFIPLIGQLKSRGLKIHGLVAGGVHRRRQHFFRQLRAQIARAGLEKDITFLGHRDDLREVLAVSDVVLSLSSNPPEAFGRTTLEALNLGRPVVGYNHGGTREVMSRLFPQGLVSVRDGEALAAKVHKFLTAPPRVPNVDAFPLSHMLDATLALYQEVVESKE